MAGGAGVSPDFSLLSPHRSPPQAGREKSLRGLNYFCEKDTLYYLY